MILCPHCSGEIVGAAWSVGDQMGRGELIAWLEAWRARGAIVARGQNGAGTVIQSKDGGWHGFVSRGFKDGKRIRRHVRGATEDEVRQKIERITGGKMNAKSFRPLSNRSTEQLRIMYEEAIAKLGWRPGNS